MRSLCDPFEMFRRYVSSASRMDCSLSYSCTFDHERLFAGHPGENSSCFFLMLTVELRK